MGSMLETMKRGYNKIMNEGGVGGIARKVGAKVKADATAVAGAVDDAVVPGKGKASDIPDDLKKLEDMVRGKKRTQNGAT